MKETKKLAEALIEMLDENMKLQMRINKAIEYIKEQEDYFNNYPLVNRKHLLQILGDKENE